MTTAVAADQRVERQQAERRRAVDDDVVVLVGDRRQRVAQPELAPLDVRPARPRRRPDRASTAPATGSAPRSAGSARAAARRLVLLDRRQRLRRCPRDSVPLGKPSPDVALACGSMSTTSTRWPACASDAARLTVVVVLPTPPFWFAIARIRFIAAASSITCTPGASNRCLFREKKFDAAVHG